MATMPKLQISLQPSDLIMGVDPGDTTGICIATRQGKPQTMARLDLDRLYEFLAKIPTGKLALIVMEDFILNRKNQTGSRMRAPQAIGVINVWARLNQIPVVMQQANILSIAQKWSKVVPPSNHALSHDIDAYNHVFYYLRKNSYIQTVAGAARISNEGETT